MNEPTGHSGIGETISWTSETCELTNRHRSVVLMQTSGPSYPPAPDYWINPRTSIIILLYLPYET